MAHNRTSEYSAPFHRKTLLQLGQYIASPSFAGIGTWDRARSEDLYVVKGSVGRSKPAKMMIVGVVASDEPQLEPHGNWTTRYGEAERIGKTKLKFVLGRPSHDADFGSDYDLALKKLNDVQLDISESKKQEHFILKGGRLSMNFPLFIRQGLDDDAEHFDGYYEVQEEYKSSWATARSQLKIRMMKVYGLDQLSVDYRDFSTILRPGATIEVTFTLKHYAFRDNTTKTISSDTFTANIDMIVVLKAAPQPLIPGKNPNRRPVVSSLSPTKGELKLATDAFVPEGDKAFLPAKRSKRLRLPSSSPEIDWSPTPPSGQADFVEGSSQSTVGTSSSLNDIETDAVADPGVDTNALLNNPRFLELLPMIMQHMSAASQPPHLALTAVDPPSNSSSVSQLNHNAQPSVTATIDILPVSVIPTSINSGVVDHQRSLTLPSETAGAATGSVQTISNVVIPRSSSRIASARPVPVNQLATSIQESNDSPYVDMRAVGLLKEVVVDAVTDAVELSDTVKADRREQKRRKIT